MLRLALLACLSLLALPAAAQQSAAPAQSEAADALKADQDERINTSVRMASDAQAYFLMPSRGDGSFDGVSLTALQYSVDDAERHVHAFASDATHAYTLQVTEGTLTIVAISDQHESVITTTVTGPKPQDISISF